MTNYDLRAGLRAAEERHGTVDVALAVDVRPPARRSEDVAELGLQVQVEEVVEAQTAAYVSVLLASTTNSARVLLGGIQELRIAKFASSAVYYFSSTASGALHV